MTPRADVIGFDTNAARKKGLPIGAYATKTTTSDGKSIILRVKHAVGNASSPHTLLCTFQIRELGIIVDDVSKNHQIDLTGNKGTQSITFKDGTKIDLRCRHTLMSFKTSLPTQFEIATLPTYDIAIDEWNPQQYYDGMNDDISVKSLQDSIANDKCIINSSTIDFSMDDDISMKLSPSILEYIDYNSDTSTNLSYNSNEHLFNSFFTKIDVDSIVADPYELELDNDNLIDKTSKFYDVKSYYENMNYWDEEDYDMLYNFHSSGDTSGDDHDHLDTKAQLTKDMNVQSANDPPLKSNGNNHNTDGKPKQKPFHLTIDHQTIGHRERGGNTK